MRPRPSAPHPVEPRRDTLVELRAQVERLSAQLSEAQQTIEAIHSGGVDAVIVQTADGEQVYTLETADQPYRLMVEQMQQGAAMLAADGVVLFANPLLASLAG